MEDIGAVTEGISSKFKPILIYHSVRKPGYVYELTCYKGNYYQCTHCRRLGKKRIIVVRQNSVVIGNKHPEDDHHENCQPIAETGKFSWHLYKLAECVNTVPPIIFRRPYYRSRVWHTMLSVCLWSVTYSICYYLRRRRRLCFWFGLFVCWSVCPSDYLQTCERISTKFFGGVGHG